MSKVLLSTQLFCLYVSPLLVIALLSFGLYALLFQNINDILKQQEQGIYLSQQKEKNQILQGIKAHLDQSFSIIAQEQYVLSRLIAKTYQNQVVINSNFIPPIGNLDLLLDKKEIPYLQNNYNLNQRNKVSTWTVGLVRYANSLSIIEQQSLEKGVTADLFMRVLNIYQNRTLQNVQQFIGWNLNGCLISNPGIPGSLNKGFSSPYCPGQTTYDARCRIWYYSTLQIPEQKTIMISPYLATSNQQIVLTLSRRVDINDQINSVGSMSFGFEKVVDLFSKMDLKTGMFRVIQQSSGYLLYQKNRTDLLGLVKWKQNYSGNLNGTELQFFNNQVEKMISLQETDTYKPFGFEFTRNLEIEYCLVLPIKMRDVEIVGNVKKLTSSNVVALIYTFRKDEMMKNLILVENYLANIFRGNSVLYLLLVVLPLGIMLFYSHFSAMIFEFPISKLTAKIITLTEDITNQRLISFQITQDVEEQSCWEIQYLEQVVHHLALLNSLNQRALNGQEDPTQLIFMWANALTIFNNSNDFEASGVAFANLAHLQIKYNEGINYFIKSLVCAEQEYQKASLQKQSQFPSKNEQNFTEEYKMLKSDFTQFNQVSKYISGMDNSNNPEIDVSRKQFDRLFGYSQALLSKYLDEELSDKNKLLQNSSKNCIAFQTLTSDNLSSSMTKRWHIYHLLYSSVFSVVGVIKSPSVENYKRVLEKLHSLAKQIQCDPNRLVLVELELSKIHLLKGDIKLSSEYLDLAFTRVPLLEQSNSHYNKTYYKITRAQEQQTLKNIINLSIDETQDQIQYSKRLSLAKSQINFSLFYPQRETNRPFFPLSIEDDKLSRKRAKSKPIISKNKRKSINKGESKNLSQSVNVQMKSKCFLPPLQNEDGLSRIQGITDERSFNFSSDEDVSIGLSYRNSSIKDSEDTFCLDWNSTNIIEQTESGLAFPLKIIQTRLLIQQSLILFAKNELIKAFEIITDTLEQTPFYLSYDRLISLEILEYWLNQIQSQPIYQKFDDKAIRILNEAISHVKKLRSKINGVDISLSIILSSPEKSPEFIGKQLFQIFRITNNCSFLLVNDTKPHGEQCASPVLSEKPRKTPRWKRLNLYNNFVSQITDFLQKKVILQSYENFIASLRKSTDLLNDKYQRSNNCKFQNIILIISGKKQCFLEESDHPIFHTPAFKQIENKLADISATILIFNPKKEQYNKFSFDVHLFKTRYFSVFSLLINYLHKKTQITSIAPPYLIEKI